MNWHTVPHMPTGILLLRVTAVAWRWRSLLTVAMCNTNQHRSLARGSGGRPGGRGGGRRGGVGWYAIATEDPLCLGCHTHTHRTMRQLTALQSLCSKPNITRLSTEASSMWEACPTISKTHHSYLSGCLQHKYSMYISTAAVHVRTLGHTL